MDLRLNLNSETVDHAHPTDALIVTPNTRVCDVLAIMKERNRSSVTVCSVGGGELVGIFTERDAVRLLAGSADLEVPIEQVMVREVVTLTQRDTVAKAIAMMWEGGYRRLPILDEAGRPVGMLGVAGILHYMVEHFPDVVYTLPPQPHAASQERDGA